MTKIEKIPREELRAICLSTETAPSAEDQDEMAIPSYLHPNPIVRWVVWRRHQLIADLGAFDERMEVLDFGCGPGIFLPTLCATGATVHAIDLFPGFAQRLCKARRLNVRFHDHLDSIKDGSLDAIVAAEVLEHIDPGLDELLGSFAAKLKDDGRLLVSVPVEGRTYRLGRYIAGFGGKGHYHHHKGPAIIASIKKNGFVQRRLRGIPFNVMPSLYLVAEFLRGTR